MDDWELWPDHAYVPGKTPRHHEGFFDVIRETATADLSSSQLSQSHAFRLGLRYLEDGFYWEAHEVFEPVWMVLPDPSVERRFVQGLIQIANGFLKVEMDRPKAAARLIAIARDLVPESGEGQIMGVELSFVHALLASLDKEMERAL